MSLTVTITCRHTAVQIELKCHRVSLVAENMYVDKQLFATKIADAAGWHVWQHSSCAKCAAIARNCEYDLLVLAVST